MLRRQDPDTGYYWHRPGGDPGCLGREQLADLAGDDEAYLFELEFGRHIEPVAVEVA